MQTEPVLLPLSFFNIITLTNGNVLPSINAYNWDRDSSYYQKIHLYTILNCYMDDTTKYIHHQIQIVFFPKMIDKRSPEEYNL